jgi:hypothetical protein
MKPNTNSLVLWSNARIQLIVTGLTERSKNKKTGGMIQTYIIRTDMSPLDAMRQDKDKAICGNCPLRGSTKKQGKRKDRLVTSTLAKLPKLYTRPSRISAVPSPKHKANLVESVPMVTLPLCQCPFGNVF